MDIEEVRNCADYFKKEYLDKFYIVTTYNNKSFILLGEASNFPHLVGISKRKYSSNSYKTGKKLFEDIIGRNPINTSIIPNKIQKSSSMYGKVKNFTNSIELIWNNKGPLAINFEPTKSASKLGNVDLLLTDINKGYMLGWVFNKQIQISPQISLKKYCVSTWIDESGGSSKQKHKYMGGQDIDLIRSILVFNSASDLLKEKKYEYTDTEKEDLLTILSDKNSNLLVGEDVEEDYIRICKDKNIACQINGVLIQSTNTTPITEPTIHIETVIPELIENDTQVV